MANSGREELMNRYRPAQAVTAVVYGSYGALFVTQPAFIFGAITFELLLTASMMLGSLFLVTAVLAAYVAYSGNRKVLPIARVFEGSTALGMAAIYFYACIAMGWGAVLGVLIWLHVGATAMLWMPSYANELDQVKGMLEDASAAQGLLTEMQNERAQRRGY